MNISQWIDQHAAFTPHKTAIEFEGKTISYAELANEIERAAAMLTHKLGVERGDRVAVMAHNVPEYLIALFACARIGAILTTLNWRLAEPELRYILQNAVAKILLIDSAFASTGELLNAALPNCQLVGIDYAPSGDFHWEKLIEATAAHESTPTRGDLHDPLLLVYTSGTTGLPKGALLTQNALFYNAINSQHMQDLTSADTVFTPLPLFHVGGLNNQTTPALHAGATILLHRRFDPAEALAAINTGKPTVTCLVPATMQACMSLPQWNETDFTNLRINITGSTLVPVHLSDAFRDKGVAVLEMYGLTESGPISIYQRTDSDFSKRGSTGLPGLHCDACIVDIEGKRLPPHAEGEILLRGPSILREYWRDTNATNAALKDGWFYTGDIGYYDEDGYFWVKDRKKNMIISGGENIYAAEVERVLYQHPDLLECALIGQADPTWGEKPVAFIVPRDGATLDTAELNAFMDGKLARFKLPKEYHFVDALPKNAMGKILHYKIREQAEGLRSKE